jgi:hypothetical protein
MTIARLGLLCWYALGAFSLALAILSSVTGIV